jgi:dipeptidase D
LIDKHYNNYSKYLNMSKEILALNPTSLWKNFYDLTQIPRPSKHESQVKDFIVSFGKRLGLETIVDDTGNVIIRKPATHGMENRKGVILQGHLDMVPQKNTGIAHDFEKDPIDAYIDGEWVKAKDTTLGGDNGMGIAATMCILESKDLKHGPVEALFTIDEETGMTGAFGLKKDLLNGSILLNLDSEDEGELYIGCAGGTNANILFRYKEVSVPAGMEAFRISLTGLKGGHSGVDIHLGRGNSNKIATRILWEASQSCGLRLSGFDGGSLRNAIPREAFLDVVVPASRSSALKKLVSDIESIIKKELSAVETGITIEMKATTLPSFLIDETFQKHLIHALYACPNGVMRMSNDMPGLVETSNNMALVKTSKNEIKVQCLLRSSVDSAKIDLEHMIQSVFEMAGANIIFDGQYPGWKPNPDSAILKTMLKIYENLYGRTPEIKAIHAGLECGILGGTYPHWDMISFGPTIRFPHSPDEKVNILSVQKFWDFLVATLEQIPNR